MVSNIAAIIAYLRANLSQPDQYKDIGPIPVPDDASFPYITVQSIMEQELSSHDGPSGMGPCIIQVNCVDPNYEEAFTLRNLVHINLRSFQGLFVDRTIQGSNFMYAHETFDAERELHMLHSRYRIWFET